MIVWLKGTLANTFFVLVFCLLQQDSSLCLKKKAQGQTMTLRFLKSGAGENRTRVQTHAQ